MKKILVGKTVRYQRNSFLQFFSHAITIKQNALPLTKALALINVLHEIGPLTEYLQIEYLCYFIIIFFIVFCFPME